MTLSADVVVIGAGPAGLAAGAETARLGLRALVLDEQSAPGGQVYRGAGTNGAHRLAHALGKEHRRGHELIAAFRASGAILRSGQQVLQIESGGRLFVSDGEHLTRVSFRKLIVAVGALERPVTIPGWTLPGVMSAGAAQILFKTGGIVPDERVWLAGSGPLPLLLIAQIRRAGGRIAGFLDTARAENRRAAIAHLPAASGNLPELARGLGLLATLRRSGLRHEHCVDSLEALGNGRLQAVRFRRGGSWHEVPASGLLLHEGVVPNIHITMALRCGHAWDPLQLCFRPMLDPWGRTDVADVLVAGDAGGIGGAAAAEESGRLAALAAASDAGALAAAEAARLSEAPRRALARARATRRLLDAFYRPRPELLAPADSVVICRCEGVTAGEVRKSIALGCLGPDQVKALTRCGMGPCQGRECGLTLSGTIAAARGIPPAEVGFFRIRPPLRQLRMAELASLATEPATA